MPEEVGTDTTRSDVPSADDSLLGEKTEDKPVEAVEEQDTETESAGNEQGADEAEEQADDSDDLKIVVSIKGSRATIGVQKPSADPHIETFEDRDLSELAQEVPAVTERARAKWEETPKHPAYERPAPPARRRNRRQQGAAQDATADGAETEQAQQTLRLF